MSVRKTDNPENSYNIPHSKLDIDQLEWKRPSKIKREMKAYSTLQNSLELKKF